MSFTVVASAWRLDSKAAEAATSVLAPVAYAYAYYACGEGEALSG